MPYHVDPTQIDYSDLIPDTQAIWDAFEGAFASDQEIEQLKKVSADGGEALARYLTTMLMEKLGGLKWQIQSYQTHHFDQNDMRALELLRQGIPVVEVARRTYLSMHRVKRLATRKNRRAPDPMSGR